MGCQQSTSNDDVTTVKPIEAETSKPEAATVPATPGGEAVPDRYYKRVRRTSVSAESMNPNKVDLIVHPKTFEEKALIKKFIQESTSFLWKGMTEEKVNQVADAMQKKEVEKDVVVITQGEDGDLFYLVSEGELEVFLRRDGNSEKEKVMTYGPGGSFGELALMYLCPRAATVIASTKCTLWCLDRIHFQSLVTGGSDEGPTKPVWEDFLAEMDLLKKLNKYERMMLADAIEEEVCEKGETVIQQGDEEGKCFFLVQSGKCVAELDLKDGSGAPPTVVKEYDVGMYFGELAVLDRGAQRVSVKVTSDECQLLKISGDVFEKVLTPIKSDLEAASDAFSAMLFTRVSAADLNDI